MSLSSLFEIINGIPSPWNQIVKWVLIIGLLLFTLTKTIKFVPQGERAMRKRFGKVVFKAGNQPVYLDAGMHILFPFVHNLECVSILDRTLNLLTIRLQFGKFRMVDITATVTVEASDIYRIRYAVDDFDRRLSAACEAQLRQILSGVKDGNIDKKQSAIAKTFHAAIIPLATQLGVVFKALDITNVAPDAQFAIAGAIESLGLHPHALEALGVSHNTPL